MSAIPFNFNYEIKSFTGVNVITGPMFCGKTTFICELVKNVNYGIVVFTHIINKHIDDTDNIQFIKSRNYNKNIICKKLNRLSPLCDSKTIEEFKRTNIKYIVIDEVQFFDDLLEFVIYFKNLNFVIFLCGLEIDYKKNKFGYLYKLENEEYVSYFRLSGVCTYCSNPSIYTLRMVETINQILLGDENYTPCCSGCYDKYSIE